MRRMLRPGGFLAVAAFLLFAAPSAEAAITDLSAKPNPVKFGSLTTISGKATPGQPVELAAKPAGKSSFSPADTQPSDTDGSFTFADLGPDRNTTYRVSTPVDDAKTVRVVVNEKLTAKLTPLGLGRMRLKVVSQHPSDLKWGKRRVYVFVAQGSARYRLVARERTSQSVTVTRLTADFPVADAGRFQVYTCFDAPGDRALGRSDQHASCHHHSFVRKPHRTRKRSIQAFEKSGFAPLGYP